MDQDNLSQSKTHEEGPDSGAEASTAALAPPSNAAIDPNTNQPPAPPRPRRPQRTARVEGSVDISEPRVEPKTEPSPPPNQNETTPDGSVPSSIKPSHPAGECTGPSIKAGPKGPGHHPVRAASVPQPPPSRPVPSHLNPHAQRALSVAGTADTQPQTLEDFRLVSPFLCLTCHPCIWMLDLASHFQTTEKESPQYTHQLFLYSENKLAML